MTSNLSHKIQQGQKNEISTREKLKLQNTSIHDMRKKKLSHKKNGQLSYKPKKKKSNFRLGFYGIKKIFNII